MKRAQRPLLTIAVLLAVALIVTACAKAGDTVPEFTTPQSACTQSLSGR